MVFQRLGKHQGRFVRYIHDAHWGHNFTAPSYPLIFFLIAIRETIKPPELQCVYSCFHTIKMIKYHYNHRPFHSNKKYRLNKSKSKINLIIIVMG